MESRYGYKPSSVIDSYLSNLSITR